MRTLILIPMIHSDPDLGAAAEKIRLMREKLYGPARLARHEEVVAAFWQGVGHRLGAKDAARVKIYQDGMVEAGAIGDAVVRELAAKGSPNFQCIARLMADGAEIRKTEDLVLIRREYELTMNLVRARSLWQKLYRLGLSRIQKGGLLKKRDRFMAHQINTTLEEGEVGVLFVGAAHQVQRYLDTDIQVDPFKTPGLVRAYMKAVKRRGGEEELLRLGEELIA